eukprot:scaffold4384_cov180-Ochromonas_danica.AAC.3
MLKNKVNLITLKKNIPLFTSIKRFLSIPNTSTTSTTTQSAGSGSGSGGYRPRRSVLYLPGSNLRAIEKAATLPVDSIIFDLEDAVAPDAKVLARELVTTSIKKGGFGHREVIIRVNSLETAWGHDDLQEAVDARPHAILIPKVNKAEDILRVNHFISLLGGVKHTSLWAMMETPHSILNALSIASTASTTRLNCLVMGTNDLAKETRVRSRSAMDSWLMTCLAAARCHGLDIIDGVCNSLSDLSALEKECQDGRDRGFDGKTLIHPSQVDVTNRVFAPSEVEVVWAKRVIDVFNEPQNKDKGAVRVDGTMVERLHVDMARRTVAIAEALAHRV